MNFIGIGRIQTPHKQAAGTPIQPTRATWIEGAVIMHPEYADGSIVPVMRCVSRIPGFNTEGVMCRGLNCGD